MSRTKWQERILSCLSHESPLQPREVSLDARKWIEGKLDGGGENFRVAFEELDKATDGAAGAVLSNFLQYCYQASKEPFPQDTPDEKTDDRLQFGKKAQDLADFIGNNLKKKKKLLWINSTLCHIQEEDPEGPDVTVDGKTLACILRDFADLLTRDFEREKKQKLRGRLQFRGKPRKVETREAVFVLEVVRELGKIFPPTIGDADYPPPVYRIAGSLFAATFGREIDPASLRRRHIRLQKKGFPVSLRKD